MAASVKQFYDLHGYHPVMIDERVLSLEQRRAAFEDYLAACVRGQIDDHWQDDLMPDELTELQRQPEGPCVDDHERLARQNRISVLRQLCYYRRYARSLYGDGEPVWGGDGLPPWLKSGA